MTPHILLPIAASPTTCDDLTPGLLRPHWHRFRLDEGALPVFGALHVELREYHPGEESPVARLRCRLQAGDTVERYRVVQSFPVRHDRRWAWRVDLQEAT